ncbi:MAG: NAD-dependent protein deacetylase [Gammaproteobacteria bacterium]|nr:NAD-dependent protein deacetylase [Gammaproteobacteria bacterium]MDH3373984.1 NAD-dependent protein deacetylase [Gammaproteobacteria bacterium]MDH3552103.1 NAD-dependent protein deacetylase [Gammaproteobacteria bacterium]
MASQSKSLAEFLSGCESIAVLSGAGVSTASGIPGYRDRNGAWKTANPIQYTDFVNNANSRRRYWSRSYVGWQRFSAARPNAAHHALANLEATGLVDTLITQNVDRLHHAAGSRRVIDLHGDLGKVRCLDCDRTKTRSEYQRDLSDANPRWHAEIFRYTPDGDAELAAESHRSFSVPECIECGGTVKPDVVMFGESVPTERVQNAKDAIDRVDALLVVGSSLMVFSGYRFARQASEQQKPIAIVNQGRTRADDLATLKVDADCGRVLSEVSSAI